MLGTAGSEDYVSVILGHLEAEMAAALAQSDRPDRVLPGAAALLSRLHADPRVFQTVLTGNIAANARMKLATFGLDRWLDLSVGAFGSDRADRNELVPVARDRVARLRGLRFADHAVWVVGDPAPTWPAPGRPASAACWWPPGALIGTSSTVWGPMPCGTTCPTWTRWPACSPGRHPGSLAHRGTCRPLAPPTAVPVREPDPHPRPRDVRPPGAGICGARRRSSPATFRAGPRCRGCSWWSRWPSWAGWRSWPTSASPASCPCSAASNKARFRRQVVPGETLELEVDCGACRRGPARAAPGPTWPARRRARPTCCS